MEVPGSVPNGRKRGFEGEVAPLGVFVRVAWAACDPWQNPLLFWAVENLVLGRR